MKIELFSKMVREKALTEPKRILDALNKRHAQVLDDMEVACDANRVTHLEGIYKKHYDKQRKAIAKAHSDAQTRILRKRSALLESLKEGLRQEVAAFVASETYELQLSCRVSEALEALGDAAQLVVVMRPEDAQRLSAVVNVAEDDRLIGGFYVLKDGAEKYDYTLDSALDDLDAFLGCMMNTLYETAGEGCDEDNERDIEG